MKIIKKTREDAILPKQGTKYSAGFDLFVPKNDTIRIKPMELVKIPLGIAIDHEAILGFCNNDVEWFKTRYAIFIHNRSSMGAAGLINPIGVGVVDLDYPDEIMTTVMNLTATDKVLQGGTKVAQLIIAEHRGYLMDDTYKTDTVRTGGFGSTGA